MLIPTDDLWSKGSEILSLRIGNKNLDSMQVKKETLKAAPLEVGRGDPHVGRPKVPMMFDWCF